MSTDRRDNSIHQFLQVNKLYNPCFPSPPFPFSRSWTRRTHRRLLDRLPPTSCLVRLGPADAWSTEPLSRRLPRRLPALLARLLASTLSLAAQAFNFQSTSASKTTAAKPSSPSLPALRRRRCCPVVFSRHVFLHWLPHFAPPAASRCLPPRFATRRDETRKAVTVDENHVRSSSHSLREATPAPRRKHDAGVARKSSEHE